jgi:GNAT superfamily N-acetyltransferase
MRERRCFSIAPVRIPDDLAAVVRLFRAYASSLDIDLSYQDFEAEMQAMPGKYAPPAGELLLARSSDGTPVGCVGLRPIEPRGCCEMKRLYVAPEGRGAGLGERLVAAVVREAERIGYREMRLDTLPSMSGAMALYRKLGFVPNGALLRHARDRHDLHAPVSGVRVKGALHHRRPGTIDAPSVPAGPSARPRSWHGSKAGSAAGSGHASAALLSRRPDVRAC